MHFQRRDERIFDELTTKEEILKPIKVPLLVERISDLEVMQTQIGKSGKTLKNFNVIL